MGLEDVVARVRSGVFHIVTLDEKNERIANGTGFLSGGYFITNNHVYVRCINAARIWIRREGDKLPHDGWFVEGKNLPKLLKAGSDEHSYDYAILDLPQVVASGGWPFHLRKPEGRRIGEPVALLGFPLDHDNLSRSSGVISSFYQSGVASMI